MAILDSNAKRHMALPLAALLVASIAVLSGCSPNRAAYRGFDLIERESGINVTAGHEERIIAVTSTRSNYSLILPYSDKWDFSWREGYLLQGRSGGVNVVLRAMVTEETPDEHLRKLKRNLEQPGTMPGLEGARIIRHRGERVLVTVVDGARATETRSLSGVKHLNLFSARKWKSALYLLHISTPYLEAGGSAGIRDEFLDYSTAGFSASYMRDHKSIYDDAPSADTLWRRGGARRK